jgi:hypothetical protein
VRTGVNVFFLLVVLVLAPDSDFSSSLFIQSGSSWWSSYFLLASCSPLGVASLESLLGPVADPCSQLGLGVQICAGQHPSPILLLMKASLAVVISSPRA